MFQPICPSIDLIFIVILTLFQPICPSAFFKYFLLKSRVHIESQTELLLEPQV